MTDAKTTSESGGDELKFLAEFARLRREKASELRDLDEAVVKTARAASVAGAPVEDLIAATGASEATVREWLKPGKPDWDETPTTARVPKRLKMLN